MRDFTLQTLHLLLSSLSEKDYSFLSFSEYLQMPGKKFIILRHDVDARSSNSLVTARLENSMGITGTYYFRTVPGSYDEAVIREIAGMGHEIGYHYEDLAVAKGDYDLAIRLFEQNLAKLRRLVPVETICMHGSPLSKYDNRLLWEKYNYSDYGITGEPYRDTDFGKVLYITDTGRRWDGTKFSIRDRIDDNTPDQIVGAPNPQQKIFPLHSTFDIINTLLQDCLPPNIMITLHPQRWDDRLLPWLKELLWQNIKNAGKRIIQTLPAG